MPKLTEKQKKFCDEYLISLNATQAAIKAGYSKKTAYSIGQENLKKIELHKYINERLEEIRSKKIANIDEIMQGLTSIFRNEVKEEVPLMCGDGIQELVKKEVSIKDRLKAGELLGKRYGMFKDNFNIEGSVPIVILGDDKLED